MRRLLTMEFNCACSRALTKLGIAMAAKRPMMATTIMISTRVKPDLRLVLICILLITFCFCLLRCEQRKRLVTRIASVLFTNCLLQPQCECKQGRYQSLIKLSQPLLPRRVSLRNPIGVTDLCRRRPIPCHHTFEWDLSLNATKGEIVA